MCSLDLFCQVSRKIQSSSDPGLNIPELTPRFWKQADRASSQSRLQVGNRERGLKSRVSATNLEQGVSQREWMGQQRTQFTLSPYGQALHWALGMHHRLISCNNLRRPVLHHPSSV